MHQREGPRTVKTEAGEIISDVLEASVVEQWVKPLPEILLSYKDTGSCPRFFISDQAPC